jgi:hypothetical protein
MLSLLADKSSAENAGRRRESAMTSPGHRRPIPVIAGL